ncbi:hypothetical protein [Fictibacillus sp. FJAT-27399]|uniref:hypothetical protein n=1 Tax=Fictibacillus sp. FJAT-27399 TaxID=1729689 RepID=UPI00078387D6|nr:hypothetical protein [Fictibacillus sp. FJAT-27399]
MGATEKLKYETFIRFAFKQAGKTFEHCGDQAHLANTGVFISGELHEVKAAISYSMCILNSIILREHFDHPTISDEGNYIRMNTLVKDVINAIDKMSTITLIDEYKEKFFPILVNPLKCNTK